MINTYYLKRIPFLIGILVLLSGCATTTPIATMINTIPQGGAIYVDDSFIGTSPVSYEFDFHTQKEYKILAKKDGYFSERIDITSAKQIKPMNLAISPLWMDTAESPATNQWLLLVVNPNIEPLAVWQRMVDAVTKKFPDLEDFDYNSGYIKSSVKGKRYATKRGEFRLRTRFVATITEEDPLTYKIKILSEWTDKGLNWYPYPRVFKKDARLIEEMVDRFSAQ